MGSKTYSLSSNNNRQPKTGGLTIELEARYFHLPSRGQRQGGHELDLFG
jgi:hypothetical protein